MNESNPRAIQPDGLASIDLRRLQAFLFAARCQSFATAAQSLSVVPSAISHAIKGLEEDLNCGLFQRQGPKVLLTREGLRLVPFVEEILARIDALRDEVKLIKNQKDCLRLMVPELICSRLLPLVLPKLQECMPAMSLTIMSASSSANSSESLREQQSDVVLAVAGTLGTDFVRRDLFEETLGFYAAPDHPLAKRNDVAPADFEKRILMACDVGTQELFNKKMSHRLSDEGRFWILPSVESVHELIYTGRGVAVLPTWAVQNQIVSGRLKKLIVHGPQLTRTWSGYWLGNAHPSWGAEVLLDLMTSAGQEAQLKIASSS